MTNRYAMKERLNDPRTSRSRSFLARRLSAQLRALPSFLVVGAMKSGTTSLFDYLCQHQAVSPPFRKEIHYFGLNTFLGRGPKWYRAHFPLKIFLAGGRITGEATPDYMFAPDALQAARNLLPAARVIALLRNPAERAVSHYYHERKTGREHLTLEQALEVEEERLSTCDLETWTGRETYMHASYKARGVYEWQIRNLYRLFGENNCLVLQSERFFVDPSHDMMRVFDFLELNPDVEGIEFVQRNVGTYKEPVPESVTSYLHHYFKPHNERLYDLLGDDFAW